MSANLVIHGVKSISVERKNTDYSNWLEFVFVDRKGDETTVTAFYRGAIQIEGATFFNFVAAHEEQNP